MNEILIIDAGSTKIEWILVVPETGILSQGRARGFNALLETKDSIAQILGEMKNELASFPAPSQIFYYGAGCATPQLCEKITLAITELWPSVKINVESDLLGAARALFGEKKGIACILGTGSNSCLYEKGEIKEQIPSLGYILGDEGSGAALGKRLLSDCLKGQLPQELAEEFLAEYNLSLPIILERVYNIPCANSFLASFTPFLKKNLWRPEIYSLVLKELARFIKRNVAMYKGAQSLHVGFVGSISTNFEKVLREAASSFGYSVDKISASPLEGLMEYHLKTMIQ